MFECTIRPESMLYNYDYSAKREREEESYSDRERREQRVGVEEGGRKRIHDGEKKM